MVLPKVKRFFESFEKVLVRNTVKKNGKIRKFDVFSICEMLSFSN